MSEGPPDDQEDDIALPVWAGVVPIDERFGTPVIAPDMQHDLPVPGYVKEWTR